MAGAGRTRDSLPSRGWEVRDGALGVTESGGGEASFGGDLVTIDEYGNFEPLVDFKLTEGANSGIKYFVIEAEPKTPGSAKGLEYQLLDDARHPDAKLGSTATEPAPPLRPHSGREQAAGTDRGMEPCPILVKGNTCRALAQRCEGARVQARRPGIPGPQGREQVPKISSGFGEYPAGHILLQDHGNRVFFGTSRSGSSDRLEKEGP